MYKRQAETNINADVGSGTAVIDVIKNGWPLIEKLALSKLSTFKIDGSWSLSNAIPLESDSTKLFPLKLIVKLSTGGASRLIMVTSSASKMKLKPS